MNKRRQFKSDNTNTTQFHSNVRLIGRNKSSRKHSGTVLRRIRLYSMTKLLKDRQNDEEYQNIKALIINGWDDKKILQSNIKPYFQYQVYK